MNKFLIDLFFAIIEASIPTLSDNKFFFLNLLFLMFLFFFLAKLRLNFFGLLIFHSYKSISFSSI